MEKLREVAALKILMVPERPAPMFGSTVKAMLALPPPPFVLEVIVTKLERLVAVQSQPLGELMSKLPDPPVTGKTCKIVERLIGHAALLVDINSPQPPEMLPALLPLSSTR